MAGSQVTFLCVEETLFLTLNRESAGPVAPLTCPVPLGAGLGLPVFLAGVLLFGQSASSPAPTPALPTLPWGPQARSLSPGTQFMPPASASLPSRLHRL